jgi:hypothetical protein
MPNSTESPAATDRPAVAYLRTLGAGGVDHINGDLLTHLLGTEALLRAWGASEALQLAGLCHAAYGTDGFAESLLDVRRQRSELRRVIGADAEALVYFYAACDRNRIYAGFGSKAIPSYVDRYTGEASTPERETVCQFVELTFANELELARSGAAFRANVKDFFEELFPRCREFVSAGGWTTFEETFAD